MTVYADSSALVKLYADEEHSDVVRRVPSFVISLLARVEVPAALWAKQRGGVLTAPQTGRLLRRFEADFGGPTALARFAAVPVTPAIVSTAAALAAGHGLRAYDAVQLATARAARSADPDCERFACFDVQLRRAAAAEGFDVALPV